MRKDFFLESYKIVLWELAVTRSDYNYPERKMDGAVRSVAL